MPHLCHVNACLKPVRPTLLMCPHHWARVPTVLRFAVIRAYRRGQCADKRPSRDWLRAARAALNAVAALEAAPSPP